MQDCKSVGGDMIRNRCKTSKFSNQEIPYHLSFHKEVDLKMFKRLGFMALIYILLPNRTKLDVVMERGTLVRISEGSLCYQVCCHSTKHIVKVRNVTFIEDDEDQLIVNEFSPIKLGKVTSERWTKKLSDINYKSMKGRSNKPKLIKLERRTVAAEYVP